MQVRFYYSKSEVWRWPLYIDFDTQPIFESKKWTLIGNQHWYLRLTHLFPANNDQFDTLKPFLITNCVGFFVVPNFPKAFRKNCAFGKVTGINHRAVVALLMERYTYTSSRTLKQCFPTLERFLDNLSCREKKSFYAKLCHALWN